MIPVFYFCDSKYELVLFKHIINFIRTSNYCQKIILHVFEIGIIIFVISTLLYSFFSIHSFSVSSTMNTDIKSSVITKLTKCKTFDKKHHIIISSYDKNFMVHKHKIPKNRNLQKFAIYTSNHLSHNTQQGIIIISIVSGLLWSSLLYMIISISYTLYFRHTFIKNDKNFYLYMGKLFIHQIIQVTALISIIIATSKIIFLPYLSTLGEYMILLYNPCILTFLSLQFIASAYLYRNKVNYKKKLLKQK